MLVRGTLILCAAMALPGEASAMSAEELAWKCSGYQGKTIQDERSSKTRMVPAEAPAALAETLMLTCIAYLQGSLDMLQFLNGAHRLGHVCMPKSGIPVTLLRKVFLKWAMAEENKQLVKDTARIGVFDAVKSAFPCRGG